MRKSVVSTGLVAAVVLAAFGVRSIVTRRSVSTEVAAVAGQSDRSVAVFVIDGEPSKAQSCRDIQATRRALDLYARSATSDTTSVVVTISDNVEGQYRVTPDGSFGAKPVADHLEIVATVSGGDPARWSEIVRSTLDRSRVDQDGEPTSLTVAWPAGFRETNHGRPWHILGSWAPDGEEMPELMWTKITGLNEPFNPRFGDAPGLVEKELDGYLVSVVPPDGSTETGSALLARVRQIPLTCEVVTERPDPEHTIRVTGPDWIVSYESSAQGCVVASGIQYPFAPLNSGAKGGGVSWSTNEGLSSNCAGPIADLGLDPDQVGPKRLYLLATDDVREILVRDMTGGLITSARPVKRNVSDPLGVFVMDVSGAPVVNIEAIDSAGAVVDTRKDENLGRP